MAGKNRSALQSRWLGGSLQLIPPLVAGSAFFVDATNGASTNSGTNWDNAMATVDGAIAKCTAGAGDVIYIAPWHTETETDSTDIFTMDISHVSLIGILAGNLRPTFTLSATPATVTVSAASCRISGCKIISGVAAHDYGITATAAADNLEVDNCLFTDGGSDVLEIEVGISIAASCDNVYIHDNRMYTVPAGGCRSAIKLLGESIQTTIVRNHIQGDFSLSAIAGATAAATLLNISDNYLINIDSGTGSCISMHASTTGITANNRMMGGNSIANTWIAAGMVSIENYATGAVNASGLVEPAVDGD